MCKARTVLTCTKRRLLLRHVQSAYCLTVHLTTSLATQCARFVLSLCTLDGFLTTQKARCVLSLCTLDGFLTTQKARFVLSLCTLDGFFTTQKARFVLSLCTLDGFFTTQYRNYSKFSDTLCFRTPPIFHRNN